MSRPFIFIATNKLKEGKLDEERRRVPGLSDFIQENEPRLIAFNEYANQKGTEVKVVQVHDPRRVGPPTTPAGPPIRSPDAGRGALPPRPSR